MSPLFRSFTKFFSNIILRNNTENGQCVRNMSLKKNSIEQFQQADSPYIIVRANISDHSQILRIMHETYFVEEPTIAFLKIGPNPVSDEIASKAMAEGYTLVARCKYDGCIVGACINSSSHPWDPDLKENLACKVKCNKLRQLLMFNAYIQRLPNIWNCMGVQKVFEMEYLFVKPAHRRKGVGLRLLKDSKMLGADSGFGVVRCDATSEHTAYLCEKLRMQKMAEMPYCKYLNADLGQIFCPPHPHKSVKVFADCAPQLTEYMNSRRPPKPPKKSKKKTKKVKDDKNA